MHTSLYTMVSMGNLSAIRTAMGVITIAMMFIVTTQMRSSFNHNRTSYTELLNNVAMDGNTRAMVYVELDKFAGETLYRKIWTYNALIFLSGYVILSLLKDEKDEK